MRRRIAVTGASGFVGSHACPRLRREGFEVLEISRHNGIDIMESSLEGKIEPFRPDIVLHLAIADGSPFDTNTRGTLNVAHAARRLGVKQFIYMSTSSVYGEARYLPVDEKHPAVPITDYGRSKLVGERNSLKVFPNALILRLFNPYGKGRTYFRKYPLLPPLMAGSPDRIEDYVYIDDVVDAIVMGAKKGWKGVLNLASGEGTTSAEFARLMFGDRTKPIFIKNVDAERMVADIRKIKKLGWRPKTKLKEGVAKMMKDIGFRG
ncbi:MAG: NAD-dependent epimerase/dehydratase family protein [Candidatus Micrarchaeota archaeon]|nr:NAD-dependent epimerase/dehydratase family protein [Candidatus Micrarchaeota archaeon]